MKKRYIIFLICAPLFWTHAQKMPTLIFDFESKDFITKDFEKESIIKYKSNLKVVVRSINLETYSVTFDTDKINYTYSDTEEFIENNSKGLEESITDSVELLESLKNKSLNPNRDIPLNELIDSYKTTSEKIMNGFDFKNEKKQLEDHLQTVSNSSDNELYIKGFEPDFINRKKGLDELVKKRETIDSLIRLKETESINIQKLKDLDRESKWKK